MQKSWQRCFHRMLPVKQNPFGCSVELLFLLTENLLEGGNWKLRFSTSKLQEILFPSYLQTFRLLQSLSSAQQKGLEWAQFGLTSTRWQRCWRWLFATGRTRWERLLHQRLPELSVHSSSRHSPSHCSTPALSSGLTTPFTVPQQLRNHIPTTRNKEVWLTARAFAFPSISIPRF